MEGVQIEKSTGGLMASLSALAAVASLAAGIFMGPKGIYIASGFGATAAIVGVILAWRNPSLEKPYGFPSIMILIHGSLLFAGFTLHALFLSPLSKDAAKMPKLQTLYSDPDHLFEVRGPAGWNYRPVPSKYESGVRMQPEDQSKYMGVSEAALFVRRLETAPASPEAFLETAAAAFSERQSKRRLFDLRTERGTSIGGAPIFWSEITIRRFWVPLYQISVFGVKDRRYLVSVSATGLSAHSQLARIFCMGLFERVEITDRTP